jgi:type I restriction enzyme S subunit
MTPPGYKQTEVGVIPEEWEVKRFGKLYAEPSRNGVYKSAEFQGRGTRIVNMGEMFGLDFISDQEMSRVSLTPKEIATSGLRDGDLLFGRRSVVPAGAGKCSLVMKPLEPLIFESSIIRARLEHAEANPLFYYYFFASPAGRSLMGIIISGTNVKGIRGSELRELKIPLPPLPEQRAIATALSDVDALLAALDRLIAKQRDLKQAAMQQLLTGQTRLPGFTGEWQVKRLGDVGTFLKGSGVKKDESNSGALPCIRYGEIYTRHNDYIKEFHSFISTNVAATACLLKKGDLLFAGSGETKEEIGKCVAFVDDFEAYAGGDIVILRPQGVDSLFLGYSLNTPPINRQKASRGQGDAVVHIGSSALAGVSLNLPPLPEQTAIAAVLTDMDATLSALEQRRDKTRALKQGMMQELLTGRTRLV